MPYVIGNNMPGYLPDSEPFAVDTFEDAKQALIDELLWAAEYAEEEEATDLTHAAEDINLWSRPDSVTIGNTAYWIAEGFE
jgi:hypothetical protein